MEILLIFLGLIVTFLSLLVAALYARVLQERKRAEEAEQRALVKATHYLKQKEKHWRADAIRKSTAVVKGKVAEQLVPFRDDFDYNPRDARFLGSPVDFLVFDGLTEGALDKIVLIEVKTGKTGILSRRERQVREAVRLNQVYYRVLHVGGKR